MNFATTYPKVISEAQEPVSEARERKPTSRWQRIEAFIDKAFEKAFGDDEKTIRNSLRGL